MTSRKVMSNFTFWLQTAWPFWLLLRWDKYCKAQQNIQEKFTSSTMGYILKFSSLTYLSAKWKAITDWSIKEKTNTAELQALFFTVVSWLVSFSFRSLFCYQLFQNQNHFVSSARCAVMASVFNTCGHQPLKTLFLQ